LYTRNYSSRYTEKAYNGENTTPQSTEQPERVLQNPENSGQTQFIPRSSEDNAQTPPFSNSENQPEKGVPFSASHETAHPQSDEPSTEIQITQEMHDRVDSAEQAEIIGAPCVSNIPKRRAVRTFKVRSSPNIEPKSNETPTFSERDKSCSEPNDVTRNGENEEQCDILDSATDERCQTISDTPYEPDIPSVPAYEDGNKEDDLAFRHGQKHRPFHTHDRNGEKSFFPSNALGLKNLSYEDIFLCAIMLLLINEGCEDIMILILGFL